MRPPELIDRPHAIVLAAGAGTRFAGAKLLAPFRGESLLAAAVRAALATRVRSAILVLGSGSDAIERALDGVNDARLAIVHNAAWRTGLSSSLRCGLAHLPPDASAALVFLGDMPLVSATLGDRALDSVAGGAPAAFPVFAGRPGHPVAIGRALFPALQALTGDQGARTILSGQGVVQLETDDVGCVQDVDKREDLLGLD